MASQPIDRASQPRTGSGDESAPGPGSAEERSVRPRAAVAGGQREHGRRAAESVWDWKTAQRPAMAPPRRRFPGTVVRDFAIGLLIAAGLYALGRPVVALVAACISAAVLTVRALLPASLSAPLTAAAGRVAHQVGHAVTVVVLAAVYFTVFPLFRAWRAATGSDSLRLKASRQGRSFWIDRATLPETSPDKPY